MPVPLRILIYPLFAIASFLIFFLLLFPFDSIKGRIEMEAERGLGGKYNVQIEDLSMALISGVELKKITIKEKSGEHQLLMKVDEAEIHVSLLPLIWGSVRISFDLVVDGGSLDGSVAQSGGEYKIQMDITKLNLAAFPLLKANYGVSLSSDINGKIDMEVFPAAPLRNNGSIFLDLKSLKLAESNIMGLFPLPPLDLAGPKGKSKVDLVMNRGNIEIRSLDIKGGDLDLGIGGKIYLAQRVSNFRFNLRGKLGFSEKAAAELPMLAIIEQQKAEDGLYPIAISGRLKKPNIKVGDFNIPL